VFPVREAIEWAALGVEVLAVAVMVAFIVLGTARWLLRARASMASGYEHYRITVGRSLLVGLELLVAADIIRKVALETTLMNLAALAVLVGVRTALGWTLTLEIEGRWPWQARKGCDRIASGDAC
jgi:uncharacterized membrane protein